MTTSSRAARFGIWIKRIRELEHVSGKKTRATEILREAVKITHEKN